MSALFNFQSMLMVILLMICTCSYIRQLIPKFIDMNKTGVLGTFYKMARIGERLSPYVSVCCMLMAVTLIFF